MQVLCGCGSLVMSVFYNICSIISEKIGIEINEIYCYNVHSSGGLVMKQICKILSIFNG